MTFAGCRTPGERDTGKFAADRPTVGYRP
ncbi:MAG: hypothetical protein RLZZ01_1216, partial [Actinomycetota bacterium]